MLEIFLGKSSRKDDMAYMMMDMMVHKPKGKMPSTTKYYDKRCVCLSQDGLAAGIIMMTGTVYPQTPSGVFWMKSDRLSRTFVPDILGPVEAILENSELNFQTSSERLHIYAIHVRRLDSQPHCYPVRS